MELPSARTFVKFFMAVPATSTSAPDALNAMPSAAMSCDAMPDPFKSGPIRVKIRSISPASPFISFERALITSAVCRASCEVMPMLDRHVASESPACSAVTPHAMLIWMACSVFDRISSRVLPSPACAPEVMIATTSSNDLPVSEDIFRAS